MYCIIDSMSGQREYGGIIWTNHALERLIQRGLAQKDALDAFRNPDTTLVGKNPGSVEHIKHFSQSKVTIIAKQNEQNQWLVISAWIDPPLPGSPDWYKKEEYKKYQKSGFWGKFFMTLKKQIGF